MIATEPAILPASLAGTLTDEQQQVVLEAPREKRLETLAAALQRPEPEVLAKLAAAANLDIASNLETEPDARGLLPARLHHLGKIAAERLQHGEVGTGAECVLARGDDRALDRGLARHLLHDIGKLSDDAEIDDVH